MVCHYDAEIMVMYNNFHKLPQTHFKSVFVFLLSYYCFVPVLTYSIYQLLDLVSHGTLNEKRHCKLFQNDLPTNNVR